ncbi:hypothetical protein EDD21DRAFT_420647 [Dissophora ornata]|nr:hypothetical protein EDD21DRAFT_420647 [Dissophora ornata]
MAVRNFTAPSAPVMQDILKDLYIKELKGYKPAPDLSNGETNGENQQYSENDHSSGESLS